MDEDRKITPLKTLQGLVSAQGYASRALTSHLYPEVATQLRAWKASGLRLYVYSSGSVLAQRLIFRHTPDGDLTPLFDGLFDTTTGPKTEAASYRAIAAALELPPHAIAFLSDNRRKLNAARAAGLRTVWIVREGPADHGSGTSQGTGFPRCRRRRARLNRYASPGTVRGNTRFLAPQA